MCPEIIDFKDDSFCLNWIKILLLKNYLKIYSSLSTAKLTDVQNFEKMYCHDLTEAKAEGNIHLQVIEHLWIEFSNLY